MPRTPRQCPRLPADAPAVVIYTDGGCEPNPGPGGWAAILLSGGSEIELAGGERKTTNNRMEMTAALEALRRLKRPCRVLVVTDSQYLMNSMTGWASEWSRQGWTRKGEAVPNADLWDALAREALRHDTRWRWTRGHAGQAENERCDRLAAAMMARLRQGEAAPRHETTRVRVGPVPDPAGVATTRFWLEGDLPPSAAPEPAPDPAPAAPPPQAPDPAPADGQDLPASTPAPIEGSTAGWVLATKRLRLRGLTLDDAANVKRLAGVASIADMVLLIPHPYPISAARDFVKRSAKECAEGRIEVFGVTLAGSGELIGCVGLHLAPEHRHAELGYWIGVPFQGRGYATEAARAVLAHAFRDLGLHRVHAGVFAHNAASIKVLERLGLAREGLRPQHVRKGDRFVDLVEFGVVMGAGQR